MKQFCVIGLGRFGVSVAGALALTGHEVLGLDVSADAVQAAASSLTHVIQADATDEAALRALGLRNFDGCVVAVGTDVQSSVLITQLLKELGVPHVVARATSEVHGRVLEKVGADRVVFPEHDMGFRLAQSLASPGIIDAIELAPGETVAEVVAADGLCNRTLHELDLRRRFGVNVMAIKRGPELICPPRPEDVLQANDILVVLGDSKSLRRLQER